MQQIVESVASTIDDVESVAREVVGEKEPRNMPTTTQAAMMIGLNRLFLFLFIFMFYTNVISTICSCLHSVREAYSFASA